MGFNTTSRPLAPDYWDETVTIELAPHGLKTGRSRLHAIDLILQHVAHVVRYEIQASHSTWVELRVPRSGNRDDDVLAAKVRFLAEWSTMQAQMGLGERDG